jgi:PKD repeat protein
VRLARSIALLTLVAACSSSPATSGGTDTVTIQAGDNQSAVAGTALPIHPTVLVKDAAGAPISNVAVTFAIDSGGGSLATTTATTGSDGLAAAGAWTLGPTAGSNVVRATAAGMPLVRFHATGVAATARAIITNGLVSPGGGTLTYTKAGDPLNGLTLIVPAAAYPVATTWSIVADSSIAVPLPTGFSQIGPVLVIGNGQGYADSNMTLTVPLQIAATDAVVPFYFDPVSKTLEPIPMVDITDTSATLATTHFSSDLMAIPGKPPTVRASLRAGFGDVRVVWVRTPVAQLTGTFSSTFLPGVDDWEFVNDGEYLSPLGDCEGMSISAMYYHYYYRQGDHPGPGLYHQFDVSLENPWDNVQGEHLVGSVQLDMEDRFATNSTGLQVLIAQKGAAVLATARSLTVNWILLSLKLNKAPVLLGLRRPGAGHAVIAYAATSDGTNTAVSISDPNAPGRPSSMSFAGGALAPVDFKTKASTLSARYSEAYALGVSAEVPLSQLESRWSEFLAGHAGADRIPNGYRFVIYNDETEKWDDMSPTQLVYASTFQASLICELCARKTLGANPPGLMAAAVYDASGAEPVPADGGKSELAPGANTLVVVGEAWGPYQDPATLAFLDMFKLVVTSVQLSVVADNQFPLATQLVTLTFKATPNNLPAHVKYLWDFGDETATVTTTDNPVVTHIYKAVGDWTVTVTATDLATGKVMTTTHTIVEPSAPPIWRFTSVALASETGPTPPVPDHPESNIDIQTLADAKTLVSRVVTAPSDGLLIYAGPDYRDQIGPVQEGYDLIDLQIASPAGTGAAITHLVTTGVTTTQLALQCTAANCFLGGSIASAGTTQTGTLSGKTGARNWPFGHSGLGGQGNFLNIPGDWIWWQVSATKNGTTMTGTITYSQNIGNAASDAFIGTHVVTWSFTATMVPR